MKSGVIRTVRGNVPAEEIGPILAHEHVFVDVRHGWDPSLLEDPSIGEDTFRPEYGGLARWYGASFRDNLALLPDEDYDLLEEELKDFVDAAGSSACLVEMTPTGAGQSPRALKKISEALDFHIVAGCGFYVHATHPDWIESASTEAIADHIGKEVEGGIADTPVMPGVIGEIGTSEELQPCEERVLRASSRVAKASGLSMNIHLHPPEISTAMRILDIVEDEGHDLRRTFVSHLDEIYDLEYHESVLGRGVTIGFDSFGQDGYFSPIWKSLSDNTKMRIMVSLIERGFENQLVMAQDVCKKHHLLTFGGLGYSHVLKRVVPRMQETHGITDDIVNSLLVNNPRRLLTLHG